MIKLRKLTISGFRGARFSLPFDFTQDNRSIAVYGENASGKSTITDAIEWFVRGRVDHLWKEDCKESALRNVLIEAGEDSKVTVEFSNGTKSTKSLSSDLSVSHDNAILGFHTQLAGLARENIILRHAQLHDFISQSKSAKRKAVASIIGYDDISDFRDLIQTTLNTLRRDRQYGTAKQRVEEEKAALLKLIGTVVTSPQALYEHMNEELKSNGFDLKVVDKASYLSALQTLHEKTNQKDRVERRLRLDALAKDIATLQARLGSLDKKDGLIARYNDLLTERDAIGQIQLGTFLASGTKVLDGGNYSEPKCPFCLQQYDVARLRIEVKDRLDAISEITKKLDTATSDIELLLERVASLKASCQSLHERNGTLSGYKKLCETVFELASKLQEFQSALSLKFERYQLVEMPADIEMALGNTRAISEESRTVLTREAASLQFTEYEERIIALIERLGELRRTFYNYSTNAKIISEFEVQILTLSNIFDRFVVVQNSALQDVLDRISEGVGKYYSELHPGESVDRVRLKIVGEEGVEFEYYFLGRPTYPPSKYLSESHLNSLGIVLFLSSAKLLNREGRFIVLDDIVTSFDVNHRRRLLRLIKEQFSDWQVILLTHEGFWFDMIKREVLPQGWLAREVLWTDDNGIQIEPSIPDMKALIAYKRSKSLDVSNDLRKLLEATLKEICVHCEVKMAFRYNDQNERRMSGELLSQLRSTINEKCAELKKTAIFPNLEGSNLVATVGSHDNAEKIVGGDIDVALADIDKLVSLFWCPDCRRYVEAKSVVPGAQKISCKCGHRQIDWKQ